MTITTSSVPDKVYVLYSSALTFTFSAWSEDTGACGSFSYWPTLDTGASPPTFISLDSATRTISVQSNDPTKRGIYNLVVHGKTTDATIS